MMRLWRCRGWSVIALAVLCGACETPPPRAHPGAPPPAPASPPERPLFTLDEMELDACLRTLRGRCPDLPQRVLHLARRSIGQPYDIYLLGEFPYETFDPDPLYCLSRSDCLTFCEHIYAMALSDDWWSFLRALQRLRYRDGQIGMLTRNHYTEADWNRANAFVFEDLTARLGGGAACVPMNGVIRRAPFFAKFGIGQDIPDETLADVYIPTANVPAIEGELRDGDMVNIVRGDAQAQWVGHTGLIAHGADGTVNLLHSASPAVREQPLREYLAGNARCVGARFLRLRPDAEAQMRAALAPGNGATPVDEAALRAATASAAAVLQPTGAPQWYTQHWMRAMNLQGYRLESDTATDAEFQRQVEALDAQIAGELGIPSEKRALGVLDLRRLRFAAVRPDAIFYGASVPKIAIVLAYFEQNPQLAAALPPETERELKLVLKRSDNALAARYSQLAGLEEIQKLLQSPRYRFYDQQRGGGIWCGKHYGLDQPRMGDPVADHSHAVTVRQCLRWYLMLEQGRLVSAAVSGRIKQLMAAPELEFHDDNFVAGLKGRGALVLRKNGLWEDWHLDTARVQHGEELFLIAGATEHPRGQEYLKRMAGAVDELLYGPATSLPFAHALIRHERPELAALAVTGEAAEMIHTSPELAAPLKFNEALASWNIDAPDGAAFSVEIRVGRAYVDWWSPWLHIGDWGAPPPAEQRVTEFKPPPEDDEGKYPAGKIDIDYFRAAERFDRIQYRVRAAGPVQIARFALCLSDTTGLPESIPTSAAEAPSAAAQHGPLRLAVPFRSQKAEDPSIAGRICSPTSVAMVMAYHGVERPTAEVAAACLDPLHGIYGCWPRNVQAAYAFGVPGYLTRFSDWGDVERTLAAGQPLIISIRVDKEGGLRGAPYRTTDGHLLVVCGFDAHGNLEVCDPAASTPERGMTRYARAELEECWMRATGGVTYVLLPRAGAQMPR